ncbi:MAG: lipocalin family protein [Pseudomonadales bacterium]
MQARAAFFFRNAWSYRHRSVHGGLVVGSLLGRLGLLTLLLSACATQPAQSPLPLASAVDLDRFMGDWYVIANIPTFLERDAYHAIERYERAADGTIATTFTFRKGAADGPIKTYHPRGFVQDTTTNAVWGMQFVWPIKADYRILYVSSDYRYTLIGRERRDYAWIMARTPTIPEADLAELIDRLVAAGYDRSMIRLVPQPRS